MSLPYSGIVRSLRQLTHPAIDKHYADVEVFPVIAPNLFAPGVETPFRAVYYVAFVEDGQIAKLSLSPGTAQFIRLHATEFDFKSPFIIRVNVRPHNGDVGFAAGGGDIKVGLQRFFLDEVKPTETVARRLEFVPGYNDGTPETAAIPSQLVHPSAHPWLKPLVCRITDIKESGSESGSTRITVTTGDADFVVLTFPGNEKPWCDKMEIGETYFIFALKPGSLSGGADWTTSAATYWTKTPSGATQELLLRKLKEKAVAAPVVTAGAEAPSYYGMFKPKARPREELVSQVLTLAQQPPAEDEEELMPASRRRNTRQR